MSQNLPAGSPLAGRLALPQPGLLFAVALTTIPLFVQIVVGSVAVVVAAGVFVVATARPHELARFTDEFQVTLLPVLTFATLAVSVAICWLFFGRTIGRKLAWRRVSVGQLVSVLALTVPFAVLASEVTNCVTDVLQSYEIELLRTLNEKGGEVFLRFASRPAWLVFLGACLLPGLGEEVYCRGLLSRGLVARYGVIGGTILAAGLFGAMHIEPVQAIGAFALGIGLQYVFLTTKSLFAPIILHTLNNSLAFLTMRFAEAYPIRGLTPLPDGGVAHTPLPLLAAAVLAAAALMMIMFQNRTRWRLPDGSDWNPGYVTAETPEAALGAVAVRGTVHPLLVAGATVAWGLLAAALVAAHRAVAA